MRVVGNRLNQFSGTQSRVHRTHNALYPGLRMSVAGVRSVEKEHELIGFSQAACYWKTDTTKITRAEKYMGRGAGFGAAFVFARPALGLA